MSTFDAVRTFTTGSGAEGQLYSLPSLAESGVAPNLSRLPVSIRIVLESVLRNCDGRKVTEDDVRNLANWNAQSPGEYEIPFTVARIVLQDFTGVPLLVDVAAMRDAAVARGEPRPKRSSRSFRWTWSSTTRSRWTFAGSQAALDRNMAIEFIRNRERYEFLKWGQQAFDTFSVVPPGIGIVHQVNLEYLAKGVLDKDNVYYPDTLVGTDSHTTMINGLGVVGWGVGGIEAEAGMLGQPVTFLVPEVVGVYLHGSLAEGVTATDLTLKVTQMLREHGVVGKFVEFFGPGAKALSACRTAPPSPTWLPSTARRWASSPSTARPSTTCAAPAAARALHDGGELLQGAGAVRHPEKGDDRLHRPARARPRLRRSLLSPDRSARRTASTCPRSGHEVQRPLHCSGRATAASAMAHRRPSAMRIAWPIHLDSPAGEFDNPLIEGETITATDTDTELGHGSI